MYQHPHQHPHHRSHRHPPGARPTRLIVFFLEAPTVPQEITEQLSGIYAEANAIRKSFIDYFGANVPDHLKKFTAERLHELIDLSKRIRGEVMKLAPIAIQPPAGAVNQLVIGDPIGILVAVLEADDSGAVFFPPAGPLNFVVSDPSNTVKQGVAADGVTPTFIDNGSGNTGDVSVQVTDSGNNLVDTASFSVVAATPPPPPPPEGATQLGVFFVPNTSPAASSSSTSAASSATTDAVKKAQTDAGIVVNDPHNPAK